MTHHTTVDGVPFCDHGGTTEGKVDDAIRATVYREADGSVRKCRPTCHQESREAAEAVASALKPHFAKVCVVEGFCRNNPYWDEQRAFWYDYDNYCDGGDK